MNKEVKNYLEKFMSPGDKEYLFVFPSMDVEYPRLKCIVPYYEFESKYFNLGIFFENLFKRNGISIDARYYLYERSLENTDYHSTRDDDEAEEYLEKYLTVKKK